jgi:hypothetical protein
MEWKKEGGAGIITAQALCSSLVLAATKMGICVPAQLFITWYRISRHALSSLLSMTDF